MTAIPDIPCLPLDSARWDQLQHAYGDASDIPELLRQLETVPASKGEHEPWFSLWSALAHQNDVYTASFAAVPHVVRALATSPLTADVAKASKREWTGDFLVCALSALAAAKGFGKVATAVMEMTPEVAEEFSEWFYSR